MKIFFAFCLAMICCLKLFAQTSTEDSIKATVNNLFTAMKNADSNLMKSIFAPTAILHTISKDKAGNSIVRNENINEFVSFIGKQKKNIADEQIQFNTIKIDGPLAIVWTPYKFYYNGLFSHCGVNSFQLVRLKEGWKIQYIIDTRRKENCE